MNSTKSSTPLLRAVPFETDNNALFVHFIFTHAGDCTLIEFPIGSGDYENVLIDIGREPGPKKDPKKERTNTGGIKALNLFLQNILPKKRQKIQHIVLSHLHGDHCRGIHKLITEAENSPIAWIPPCFPWNVSIGDSKSIWQDYPEKFLIVQAGDTLIQGKFTKLEVIGPTQKYLDKLKEQDRGIDVDENLRKVEDTQQKKHTLAVATTEPQLNDLSIVLKLTFCRKIAIFPGDLQVEGWNNLIDAKEGSNEWVTAMRKLVHCDLLKIPHHGSKKIPERLPEVFTPSPQYLVSTYHDEIQREINAAGQDLLNPFYKLVRDNEHNDMGKSEELYHIGDVKDFLPRVACSFAFVPNSNNTTATIVPIIYRRGQSDESYQMYRFIRASDAESR